MPAAELNAGDVGLHFLTTVVGGIGVGAVFGIVGIALLRWIEGNISCAMITFVCAYGSFLAAESMFHVSGVLASLVAGLILARIVRRQLPRNVEQIDYFWSVLAYAANGSIVEQALALEDYP